MQNFSQKYRGIYCAKFYGQGGGDGAGEKNEKLGSEEQNEKGKRGKEKKKRKRSRVIFC